jgi:hypothetical protein
VRHAKINYCARIGLGVLLEIFQSESEERQKNPQPIDLSDRIIARLSVESALQRVNNMKLPKSEVARLINRAIYVKPGEH